MINLLSNDGYHFLQNQLIKHEEFRQFPYTCTKGDLTIGIGRNIQSNGISKDEALYLLANDIERCEAEIAQNFPEFNNESEARRIVLLNMCFNLGITRLMSFRKMLAAIRVHDYDTAAREMRESEWAKEVGNRADELAYLMEKGAL